MASNYSNSAMASSEPAPAGLPSRPSRDPIGSAADQGAAHAPDLLRASLDGYLAIDPSGRVLETNEAACRLTGYARAELLELDLARLCPVGQEVEVAVGLGELWRCESGTVERQFRRKDGELRTIELSFVAGRGPEPVLHCFGHELTASRPRPGCASSPRPSSRARRRS